MQTHREYSWSEFARIPDTPSGRENGRTHGVCITRGGNVVVFHQAHNALVTYDSDGTILSAVGGDRWLGAHGLSRIVENGTEFLWLTDQFTGEVVKVTLDGETIQAIDRPPCSPYDAGGKYSPTWAAQNPDNGEIWVADGYGASLVHRFSPGGTYRATLDGTEGAGRFSCPHGLGFRKASGGPELWITDRGNRRVVVYDADGKYVRRTDVTHSPCTVDFHDDLVVIPELFTGVKILNADTLEVLAEIGANPDVTPDHRPDGWPNLAGTPFVTPGVFNSPHAACFAPDGDIYVVEWIIGGRITRLQRKP
ncbi:MAG: hypothetical protein EA426_01390 [Spirochaetaceae bacterium]|nr:MAG: hypothetical protein EA426_01390 [Spirochaetaceae bacterium]